MPQIAHLAFPLRIVNGQYETVEQDSDDDILGCVEVIARTPRGHWDSVPEMGLPELPFSRPDAAVLRSMIEPFEPRAQLFTDQQITEATTTVRLEVQTGGA